MVFLEMTGSSDHLSQVFPKWLTPGGNNTSSNESPVGEKLILADHHPRKLCSKVLLTVAVQIHIIVKHLKVPSAKRKSTEREDS